MTRKTIPARDNLSDQDKWNLAALFENDKDWEKLIVEVENELETYNKFSGRLKESVSVFKDVLEFHSGVTRRIERLYTYSHLKSDEDKSNQFYLGRHQRAVRLRIRASETASFMIPEIQSVPDEIMNTYLKNDALVEFRFFLEKIMRYKPHTGSQTEEQILAMSREMADAAFQIFGQLDNVDLNFSFLTDDTGREVELSHGNFTTFLMSPNRETRKKAFFKYYQAYKNHQHTLAATLTSSLKKDLFYSRARRFENCRAAALFDENIPDTVYDNLIETVKNNLDPLFKYFNFRKHALGLDELHFYDTHVAVVRDIDFHMPYETAVDVCVAAMEPLGREYTTILREGLLGGWVDRYENRGKRSGAYSSGCYDSPPYILLNYEENNINSLYTLIHEAGHAMHSLYSNRNRPYVDHEYTIFVAEVASTFNEDLLSRHLLQFYQDDPKMKMYILNRKIDNIRATLFRQTMFAEFEKIIHNLIETNRPLTLDVLRYKYRELLEIYFGKTMVLDPELELECLRIPHFYAAFYVYKYATGVSAAIALAENVVREGRPAREAYLSFLKLGGSKFPLEELLDAGVDMRAVTPIQRTINHFGSLVDQLEADYETWVLHEN